ncbi:Crossover junction endodeoxyribonuclease RuvC [Labeo rohita]|uniref:Crossover junction endodeoxyribonuclease RuvC n=1 Tax=Labeo rohita TaxID=84645 RepID=A0ABQ8LAI6_LABRO|nr:Crossover junction endodeoxyribonuclease RuvC [Labeo rohita]
MALQWPNEAWSLMLLCKLTGKAQELCALLSLEESVQYDAVKNAILCAYELASILADEYALMHKTTFVRHQSESGLGSQKENDVCHLKIKETWHDAVGQSRGVVLLQNISSPSCAVPVDDAEDCFKPFVFEGSVSLTGEVEDQRIVKILRDTGGSQSFILDDMLPFCAEHKADALCGSPFFKFYRRR